jgi:dihydrofolate reductase
MRRLIYSMGVSLDGFIAGPDGGIDWSAPDEELHRFHNAQMRDVGVQLCGRRLYETMLYWETAAATASAAEVESEFAGIWQAVPKLVFSSRLAGVEGNARLATDGLAAEIARLKQEPGRDLAIGGAGLAAEAIELGLVDEFHLFIKPVVIGGGTPFFPPLDEPVGLDLIETRTFGSRVVYVRYGRTPAASTGGA